MSKSLGASLLIAVFFIISVGCDGNQHDWDYLMFSQKWPITFCIAYSHGGRNPERTCLFPKKKFQWTIHGVWPSKIGGHDPFFCNRSVPFDVEKLAPLRAKLEESWPNLEGGKTVDSLWEHEWIKHGTCSLSLDALNTERKYFETGLLLHAEYNITSLLSKLNFLPSDNNTYSVNSVIQKVQAVLGKAPEISCIKEAGNNNIYLSEIRICFNKTFQMIDCEERSSEVTHNKTLYEAIKCPEGGTLIYPMSVSKKKKIPGKKKFFKKSIL